MLSHAGRRTAKMTDREKVPGTARGCSSSSSSSDRKGCEKAPPDKDAKKRKDGYEGCSALPRVEAGPTLEGVPPSSVAGPRNVNSTPECTSMDDKYDRLNALVSGLQDKLDR